MKIAALADVKTHLSAYLDDREKRRIVIRVRVSYSEDEHEHVSRARDLRGAFFKSL